MIEYGDLYGRILKENVERKAVNGRRDKAENRKSSHYDTFTLYMYHLEEKQSSSLSIQILWTSYPQTMGRLWFQALLR